MLATVRTMPAAIRVFLVYALLILTGIGLSLRWVVDQAIDAAISPTGLVVMVLLAYTIFTTTLVLQRKEASRGLALGLSSLTLPAIPLLIVVGQPIGALLMAVLATVLFRGLLGSGARAWLSEP